LIQLAFIFANSELQKSVLPPLLKDYEKTNALNQGKNIKTDVDNPFDSMLLLILKNLDPEAVADSIKPVLLEYLDAEKLNNPSLSSFATQEGVDFVVAQATLNNRDQVSMKWPPIFRQDVKL
jgi:hypothetical protein